MVSIIQMKIEYSNDEVITQIKKQKTKWWGFNYELFLEKNNLKFVY